MLDPHTLTEMLRIERQMLAERLDRQAAWVEHLPRRTAGSTFGGLRRRLARALLLLADRLDPRVVVSVPHAPARPALNGSLRHA